MSVTVRFGPNSATVAVAGQTVDEVRESYESAFSMNGDENAQVNGAAVDGDRELRDGDVLEFVKAAGSKG